MGGAVVEGDFQLGSLVGRTPSENGGPKASTGLAKVNVTLTAGEPLLLGKAEEVAAQRRRVVPAVVLLPPW